MMSAVGDRYERTELLGSGGFGSVWLARDTSLDDLVAIKVLTADRALLPDMRRRFLREARLLRRVHSDRVVVVYDVGEFEDDGPYLVMTYADGGTLDQRLTDEPMPVAAAVRLAGETALGVAELHRRGIVHRDIKPSNVLFRGAGSAPEQVLIGDLGLAADAGSVPTLLGGTPAYMAPEQARGSSANATSDVYALGVLTYRLLAGRLPGDGTSVRALVPKVPAAVDRAVSRALSADPRSRQPTAAEFAADLIGAPAERAFSTIVTPVRARAARSGRGLLLVVLLVALLTGVVGEPRPTHSGPHAAGSAAKAFTEPTPPIGNPVRVIERHTPTGVAYNDGAKGLLTSSFRVPPRSLVVITSVAIVDRHSSILCIVEDARLRDEWTRLAEVRGSNSALWVDYWFNRSDTGVDLTVASSFLYEGFYPRLANEVEVLSGVADPKIVAPRRVHFVDSSMPAARMHFEAGSRLMTHFVATPAESDVQSLFPGSVVNPDPPSVLYMKNAEFTAGVIARAANEPAAGKVIVGARQPTSAYATGVVVEYPAGRL